MWRLWALGLYVIGEGMKHLPVAGGVGTALSGFGDFLVGAAALAAALTALVTKRQTKGIADAIGPLPENGESLHTVLQRIDGFESYQHIRNHDILNQMTLVVGGVPTILRLQERMDAKLDRLLSEGP